MRIGQRHDLLAIAGVGQDFLVTGHGGIENHLTQGGTGCAYGLAGVYGAISKRQNGRGGISLERQKHGLLRVVYGCAQAPREDLWQLLLVGDGALEALGSRWVPKKPTIVTEGFFTA
jgi:hypothetical protein